MDKLKSRGDVYYDHPVVLQEETVALTPDLEFTLVSKLLWGDMLWLLGGTPGLLHEIIGVLKGYLAGLHSK